MMLGYKQIDPPVWHILSVFTNQGGFVVVKFVVGGKPRLLLILLALLLLLSLLWLVVVLLLVLLVLVLVLVMLLLSLKKFNIPRAHTKSHLVHDTIIPETIHAPNIRKRDFAKIKSNVEVCVCVTLLLLLLLLLLFFGYCCSSDSLMVVC